MVLALFLSQFREMHPMLRLLLCGAIVGAPCLLILMQPDLGETMIWGPVLLALLFVGGIPLRYLICIVLIVATFLPLAIIWAETISTGTDHCVHSIPRSTSRARPGRSINRLSRSAPAVGRAKDSRRRTRRSSSGFCPPPPCTTITSSRRSASSGVSLAGCFCSAPLRLLLLTCLFVAFFAGDQFGLLLIDWDHCAHFHPHLPERRDDHLDAARSPVCRCR